MSRRGRYEFPRHVKKEVRSLHTHKHPKGTKLEVDHIVSVRQCKDEGIPPWIASNIINAQLLTRRENQEKSDKDADPIFVDYLLSLIVRMV